MRKRRRRVANSNTSRTMMNPQCSTSRSFAQRASFHSVCQALLVGKRGGGETDLCRAAASVQMGCCFVGVVNAAHACCGWRENPPQLHWCHNNSHCFRTIHPTRPREHERLVRGAAAHTHTHTHTNTNTHTYTHSCAQPRACPMAPTRAAAVCGLSRSSTLSRTGNIMGGPRRQQMQPLHDNHCVCQ